MSDKAGTPAKIIRQIRVRQTDNPKVAVLEVHAGGGTDLYALSRKAMVDMANHLLRNSERFESDEPVELPN